MKISELRAMNAEDLKTKEKNLKKELYELNHLRKVGRVDKPSRFKSIRREIARILTILNERDQDGKKN